MCLDSKEDTCERSFSVESQRSGLEELIDIQFKFEVKRVSFLHFCQFK